MIEVGSDFWLKQPSHNGRPFLFSIPSILGTATISGVFCTTKYHEYDFLFFLNFPVLGNLN
jgi:hypothetical protein